jgi:hypothetical protein
MPAAAVPVTERHWCLGTRPGSSNSKPSKKLRIWSRLRGQTRSLAPLVHRYRFGQGDLSGKKSAPMWEEELADTGFGRQEPDNPAQEAPVLHRRPAQPGHQREHLLRRDPVRLEVVLAAQVVVIHARHVRRRHIQAQRSSLRPGHESSAYRRVYCAMITPLVVVTLLVSSNSVSGAGPSNSRAPLPRVSGQISSV